MFDGGAGTAAESPTSWNSYLAGEPQPRPAPAVVPPSAAVTGLREAVVGLLEVDPTELPEGQALADAKALLAVRAQLDALLLRRLGDVDSRRLHQLDDSPTVSAWVRAQDAPVDAATVTLARRLSRLPGWSRLSETARCPRPLPPGSEPRCASCGRCWTGRTGSSTASPASRP